MSLWNQSAAKVGDDTEFIFRRFLKTAVLDSSILFEESARIAGTEKIFSCVLETETNGRSAP